MCRRGYGAIKWLNSCVCCVVNYTTGSIAILQYCESFSVLEFFAAPPRWMRIVFELTRGFDCDPTSPLLSSLVWDKRPNDQDGVKCERTAEQSRWESWNGISSRPTLALISSFLSISTLSFYSSSPQRFVFSCLPSPFSWLTNPTASVGVYLFISSCRKVCNKALPTNHISVITLCQTTIKRRGDQNRRWSWPGDCCQFRRKTPNSGSNR